MSVMLLTDIASQVANKLGIPSAESGELVNALKNTAFKGNVTNEQLVALLVVANQYGLNPWTREIYAFPQNGGIVPIVGIDGWLKIINNHPQFDGMEFEQDDEKCTCTIYRKDRSKPISVTEYLSECQRPTDPWRKHTKRMLRHKATMQCARYAFGLALSDQDDADEIVERDITPDNVVDVDVIEKISNSEVMEIRSLLKQTNSDEEKFLSYIGVESIYSMTREQFQRGLEALKTKIEKLEPKPEFDDIEGEEVEL